MCVCVGGGDLFGYNKNYWVSGFSDMTVIALGAVNITFGFASRDITSPRAITIISEKPSPDNCLIPDSRLINEAEAIAVKIQDFKSIPTSYLSYHA